MCEALPVMREACVCCMGVFVCLVRPRVRLCLFVRCVSCLLCVLPVAGACRLDVCVACPLIALRLAFEIPRFAQISRRLPSYKALILLTNKRDLNDCILCIGCA
jgi:hypothetical protein